ncbi:MAG TPA: hypothetical protein VGI60_09450 [Chthoniobacterales bacterium]
MSPKLCFTSVLSTLIIFPAIRRALNGWAARCLTELDLPTPNLFCGEHNAHGSLEWVAVQDMESAVTAWAHLTELWERKAGG